jgi:hypothetical protein
MNKKKIYVIIETQVSKNGNIYTWIRRSFTNIVLAREFLSRCQRNYESSGNHDVATLTEDISFRAVSELTGTTYLNQLIETEVE